MFLQEIHPLLPSSPSAQGLNQLPLKPMGKLTAFYGTRSIPRSAGKIQTETASLFPLDISDARLSGLEQADFFRFQGGKSFNVSFFLFLQLLKGTNRLQIYPHTPSAKQQWLFV